MRTLVRGGTIVTAGDVGRADVLVVGETVAAVGVDLDADADQVLDATGCYVVPGGVDVHTHMELQTPHGRASDDFVTGTRAAAWGGTTTIVDYAGHDYGEPLEAGLDRWLALATGRSHIDFGFHMMVKEVTPRVLADMAGLVDRGVTSIKLFMAYPGVYMVDDAAIYRAMRRAGELGCTVALHAENGGPIDDLVHQLLATGRREPIFHARSRPAPLEAEATHRGIVLAELADVPVHIAHLSAAAALAEVRAARGRGARVHAETCPQYLFLTEDALRRPGVEGAAFICSPPLRGDDEPTQLWAGLAAGDLEVVATDHCPFTLSQKAAGEDFSTVPNGLPGVEDRLTLTYQGVRDGRISLTRWVAVTATAPAQLFGLYPRKGSLLPGSDADLVVFDPTVERTLSARTHHMNVDFSCYEGLHVHGQPRVVLQRGRRLVADGAFHGRPGDGHYLPRQVRSD